MNPQVEAAVIAGAATLVSVGLTAIVAALGFQASKRTAKTTADETHKDVGITLAAQRDQLDKTLAAQRDQLDKTLAAQRDQLDKTLDEQHVRTLNERFATAAEKLGTDKPASVQLAGIYAMAGLADDWEDNRQTCIDILCGYLRIAYAPDPGEGDRTGHMAYLGDREVRHAVIQVITEHLRDSARVSWQGKDFDFTGVVFDAADFSGAVFSDGKVDFTNATFASKTVDRTSDKFSGNDFDFTHAEFCGAVVNFTNARFSAGFASFDDAKFSGGTVLFHHADFSGATVNFSAEFSGATIRSSPGSVRFNYAEFSKGEVDFTNAKFSGGRVQFDVANFSGSTLNFNSTFSDGEVSFSNAKFSGGYVKFRAAEFFGGTVSFHYAHFSGTDLNFTQAKFRGSEVDFNYANITCRQADSAFDEAHLPEIDFRDPLDWSVPPKFPWTGEPPPCVKLPLKQDQVPA